ncbi:MAG TPA: hypothetical protein VMC83_12075 [Streptosporangiaceae bacterium]|nr:hypothetical protein [Streptosporangiaceae bacterium]
MDLNAGQRKAIFGLIVVLLVGLGVYLFVSSDRSSGHSPAAATHSPASQGTRPATPAATPSPDTTAAAAPANPDIYQWLPFTRAQLGSAATVVTQFGDAYGTWSYSQDATSYVAAMHSLISAELADVIEQGYSVPGVASQRSSKKQVSTGSAVIDSIRAFGSSSITFVVTITERITASSGQSQLSNQYAVTAVSSGTSWQVNDIELASAGNS